MKKILTLLCLLTITQLAQAKTVDQSNSNNFKAVLNLAMKGDYQAQRNIAFGYSSWPYKGQDKNPILGCAWYLVVLNSGSIKVDQTDASNVKTYCGNLDELSLQAAKQQYVKLQEKIK